MTTQLQMLKAKVRGLHEVLKEIPDNVKETRISKEMAQDYNALRTQAAELCPEIAKQLPDPLNLDPYVGLGDLINRVRFVELHARVNWILHLLNLMRDE